MSFNFFTSTKPNIEINIHRRQILTDPFCRKGKVDSRIVKNIFCSVEKSVLLNQIDIAWKKHLEKMDILRDSIGWRSYGQFDPLLEYKNESFNLFVDTTREIKYNAVYNILKSRFL